MDSQLRHDITEAILRRAVTDAFEQDILEAAGGKPQVFSQAHEKRMRALFKREKRRKFLSKAYTAARRAAVVVLIAATAMFGALLTDPNVQATIRDTIIRWYDGFTTFRFRGGDYEVDGREWLPGFIPYGFEIEEITELFIGREILFTHPNGDYFFFDYKPAEGTTISVDNDYTEMEVVFPGEGELFVFTPIPGSEHYSQVIWHSDGLVFHLLSHLDSATLLQIAVSVGPVY